MASRKGGDRHSRAAAPTLIRDPSKRARREARNSLRQFDLAASIVEDYLEKRRRYRLSTSHVLQLHKVALEGISLFAGTFRNTPIRIGRSAHSPPDAHLVPYLVQEMCDYVNSNWRRSALHLCAYVMWRMNWIHPFTDGNGRTSRITAYMVLCLRLGYVVPGEETIPEQIAANKQPYYQALETADKAWKRGKVNVSAMTRMLDAMLAKQLLSIHNRATGKRSQRSRRKLH